MCSRMSLMGVGRRSSLMRNLFLQLTRTSGEEVLDEHNTLNPLARISHQVASEGVEMAGLARRTRVRARRRTRRYVERPKPDLCRVHESAGSGFGRPQGARRGRAMDGAPQRSQCIRRLRSKRLPEQIRVRSRNLVRNAG